MVDFLAGKLIAIDSSDARISGLPQEFCADSGETGDQLMEMLLPAPSVINFYRGAVRESLAEVWSTAQIGRVDTRAWENQNDYIISNGEGDLAFVRFVGESCVGITYSDDPTRDYDIDRVIPIMPEKLKAAAREVGALPFFLFGDSKQQTSMFWGEGGKLVGAEPWYVLYTYSGDIFRGELLNESAWPAEAGETYDMPDDVAERIRLMARRAQLPAAPISIEADFLETLVPPDAPYASIALDDLVSSGAFAVDT